MTTGVMNGTNEATPFNVEMGLSNSKITTSTFANPTSRALLQWLPYVGEVVKLLDMHAFAEAGVGVLGIGWTVEKRLRLKKGT
jgi:hypothetical protein